MIQVVLLSGLIRLEILTTFAQRLLIHPLLFLVQLMYRFSQHLMIMFISDTLQSFRLLKLSLQSLHLVQELDLRLNTLRAGLFGEHLLFLMILMASGAAVIYSNQSLPTGRRILLMLWAVNTGYG